MNPSRNGRPNIVFILADDMGFGDFSFLNGGISSTPQLDDMAVSGRVFSQHYSASPVCAPARAAFLTGRYPQRTGVIDTLEARGTDRLALDEVTLADALQAAGYATGLVGKWHTGAIGQEYAPTSRGFDEFVGFRGGWQDYWGWALEANGRPMKADGRYLTDVLADEAVEFLRRHQDQPFFLHVAFNAPHFPFQAPGHLISQYRRDDRTEVVATIYAMIDAMDKGVGRIRAALSDLGLDENTLILFTSDNGPDHGGAGPLSAARFNAGLAGSKQHVLEGGIRLPLLGVWPGGLEVGHDDTFVHLTDWYPTLLSVAAADNPGIHALDGVDVSRTFASGGVPATARFWQWTRYRPMFGSNAAMRDGRWKLVFPAVRNTFDLLPEDERIDHDIKIHPERYPEPLNPRNFPPDPDLTPAPLLFDLATDPGETNDVAAAHPEVVRRMERELSAWYESVEADRRRVLAG